MSTPPFGSVIPAGYEFQGTGTCRACGAPMNWCETKAGKRAPLNLDGTSHFATCPDAERFRKAKR
jgi:hypothetical protein